MLSIDKVNKLEKENKQLKEDYKKAGETWEHLCQQKDEEIAELKVNKCTFENCPNFERLGKQFADKISELEQENERLKFQIKDLQIRKDRYYLEVLEQERQISDYIQTLQEIKAIAENCMSKDGCFECKYSDDCHIEDAEFPTYDICKLIMQKITKARKKNE